MNEQEKHTGRDPLPGSGNPFRVPERYFDSLPDKVWQRIREEEQAKETKDSGIRTPGPAGRSRPSIRLRPGRTDRLRVAAAAAIVVLALASIPMVRWITQRGATGGDMEVALLEAAGVFRSDYELALSLDPETTDPEEAYLDQVEEYLASHDVEMDLIFEQK